MGSVTVSLLAAASGR